MRRSRAVTVGVTFVVMAALAGCGGDDGDVSSASGPPEASSIAEAASYVEKYVTCQGLVTGDKYAKSHGGPQKSQPTGRSWGEDEAKDASWSIKERAICFDDRGAEITLTLISDMKKFQTTAAELTKAGGYLTVDGSMLVGENFAVVARGRTFDALQGSDLKQLACGADASTASGDGQKPALVEGCVLRDESYNS